MAATVSEPPARAILKRGREGPVRGGNPWIFSQAIERIDPPSPEAGALVTVHDASGALIGMGYCNPATTIAIRMLAWGETPAIDELVARRLKGALGLRKRFIRDDTDAYRLFNGDGDGLSGVVVDRFGDVIVVQILTAGADRMRDTIVNALNELLNPRSIIERSHGAVRKQEGLDDRTAVLAGESVTEAQAVENRIKLKIDFEHGQKTGYFLDQRDNRALAGSIASGARVLDAFCYQGGFSLAALAGGASKVVAVDTSARALEVARQNLELNHHPASAVDLVHGEAAAGAQPWRRRACGTPLRRAQHGRDARVGAGRASHDVLVLDAFSRRRFRPRRALCRVQRGPHSSPDCASRPRRRPSGAARSR
jgi:23S rRNA (cytosine1962-C5)-methyltransferase